MFPTLHLPPTLDHRFQETYVGFLSSQGFYAIVTVVSKTELKTVLSWQLSEKFT